MKKLMIAVAIVCAAAMSQAASFGWGSANYSSVAKADGTKITTTTDYNTLMNGGNIVLVLLKDGTYDGAMTVLVGNEGGTAAIRTSGSPAVVGGLNSTFKWDFDSGLLKNGDKVGVMYQDADKALSQLVYIDAAGNVGDAIDSIYTISGLSDDTSTLTAWKFTTAGTSSAANNFTVASVPEPTSGLLLLLGIGAMALRRRRA